MIIINFHLACVVKNYECTLCVPIDAAVLKYACNITHGKTHITETILKLLTWHIRRGIHFQGVREKCI